MGEYEDQLERGLEKTVDVSDSEGRLAVPDPELRQEGNVTVYENFGATLDALDRDGTHVLKFLQRTLGTSAHVDEGGRARLTGRFDVARVHDAIEEYTERFVICSECGLPDTRLQHEQGVLVLKCEACGAVSSVDE